MQFAVQGKHETKAQALARDARGGLYETPLARHQRLAAKRAAEQEPGIHTPGEIERDAEADAGAFDDDRDAAAAQTLADAIKRFVEMGGTL